MLLVETQLEGFFAVGIEGHEVEVIVGAAMQNAAAAVYGGINQGAGGAGVFCLHVVFGLAHTNICVMTENHGEGPRFMRTVQNFRQ